MPVMLRIAFRNLLEHKAKSLIIGILLALGVVILIVGNSFMDTAAKGVKDTFIANYTGDIFVHAVAKGPVSLFGVQAAGGQEDTPNVPDYPRVAEKLRSLPGVVGTAGQVTGFALVSPKDSDKQGFALLFGVEPSDYYRLFDNAVPVEGRFLEPGEEGLLISQKQAERYEKEFGFKPQVGQELLLTGMGRAGFKIRAVPLVGIMKYKSETEATDFISYADVNTVRILMGLTLGNDEDTPVGEEEKALLAADDLEALFGAEEILSGSAAKPAAPAPAPAAEAPRKTLADEGAWHFLLARAKDPDQAPRMVAELNAWFAQEGIPAQAGDWKAAAGPFAQSIDVVRIVFNIAIIIVAVVAVIIMMNTLVISVMERTGEIGTMRALGAQRGFVRSMFLVETLTVAGVFGLVGTLLALGIIAILNAVGIEATNPFLEILFAGKVLKTGVNPLSVLNSLLLVGLVAVAAHLYPVSVALRIQPVRAMQSE